MRTAPDSGVRPGPRRAPRSRLEGVALASCPSTITSKVDVDADARIAGFDFDVAAFAAGFSPDTLFDALVEISADTLFDALLEVAADGLVDPAGTASIDVVDERAAALALAAARAA